MTMDGAISIANVSGNQGLEEKPGPLISNEIMRMDELNDTQASAIDMEKSELKRPHLADEVAGSEQVVDITIPPVKRQRKVTVTLQAQQEAEARKKHREELAAAKIARQSQKELLRLQREAELAAKQARLEEREAKLKLKEAEKLRKAEEKRVREADREAKRLQFEEEKRLREEQRLVRAEIKRQKDLEKEKERCAKEEEKRVKDEEKRFRELQKEAEKQRRMEELETKRKEKEEEAKIKEVQRRKKEEELQKKQKQQLRIASFFKKPDMKTVVPSELPLTPPSSKSNSLNGSVDNKVNAFDEVFMDFFLKPNVTLAAGPKRSNAWLERKDVLDHKVADMSIDIYLNSSSHLDPKTARSEINSLLNINTTKKSRGKTLSFSIREVMSRLCSGEEEPISSAKELSRIVNGLPRTGEKYYPLKKLLQYSEDVRPPYSGTWTRKSRIGLERGRKPFQKDEDMNYDYDSEMEWQLDEEPGEDLNSEEDEDEKSQDDEDDMDDFLDDEDDEIKHNKDKKKFKVLKPTGDVIPLSYGPYWNTPFIEGSTFIDFQTFVDASPIDPYKDYWSAMPSDMNDNQNPLVNNMPVSPQKHDSANTTQSKGRSSKKPFPYELLPDFVRALTEIKGNHLLTVELLRQRFPTATKSSISEKIKQIAFRPPGKEDTQTWRIKEDVLLSLGIVL